MKEFKLSERLYIAKNVNKKTLEEMSVVLDCEMADIKKCFENMKKTGEYDELRVARFDDVYRKSEKPNSLLDLNQYLFKQLESINNNSLSDDQIQKEIEKSKIIVSVSQTIINNEKLLLEASKHFKREDKQVRQVLGAGEE